MTRSINAQLMLMSDKKGLTDKQKVVFDEGDKAEEKAANWLREHRFSDVVRNPKPTGCWDIRARKGKENWLIEVKTGEKPQIDIANFEKMIEIKGFNKIGLALVTKDFVHLLEYPKGRFSAFKAWETIRKKSGNQEQYLWKD